MRNLIGLAISVTCLALAGCGPTGAISESDRAVAINDLAKTVLTQRAVPGIAIAVVRDGKVFLTATQGYANSATREAVSSATPFQLASTTKIFGSAAVLLLVADGKVRLDDPIGNFLPDLPATWRALTVRQLMSYTSGLPDITLATGEVDLVADDWPGAYRIVAGRPFQFQPGRGWAYSQTNYALLLRMVEQVSSMTFEDFLQQRVFSPLGMTNTFFPNDRRRCAVNYEQNAQHRTVERQLAFPHYVHGAGGLCSSLDDLVKWGTALDSGKVIPRKLTEEAWTPTKLADGSPARVSPAIAYGLGWAIGTAPGQRWVGHSGGNSTVFRRYPDARLTIIVLHNGASDPDAIAGSVADAMLRTTKGGDAQTNLWDAADNGDQVAVEAALKAGADVNKLDTRSSRNGRYALNWAAFHDHPEIVRLLLARGAKVNAANMSGFTALHHAAEGGSVAATKILLAAGADRALRNANGETAADVARRKGNTAVAQFLTEGRK